MHFRHTRLLSLGLDILKGFDISKSVDLGDKHQIQIVGAVLSPANAAGAADDAKGGVPVPGQERRGQEKEEVQEKVLEVGAHGGSERGRR